MWHLFAQTATEADWLSKAGAIGVLSLAVIAFLRGWIVSAKTYEEVCAERDRALDLVYKQATVAQRAVDLSSEYLEASEANGLRNRPR